MPRKADAVVLGRADCPSCGGRMAVLQNAKDYLYSRCDNCGCDQRNGAKVQTYLWFNTDWIDGEPDKKPRNVPDQNPAEKIEPESVPNKEPDEPEKVDKKQPVKKLKPAAFLLVPIGVLLAMGLRM